LFVCIPPGKAIPEMTHTVSGGTLNPTYSLSLAEFRSVLPCGPYDFGRSLHYFIFCEVISLCEYQMLNVWLLAAAGGGGFEGWLCQLLTCACCVCHFDVEAAAIAAMFDLIVLAQSALVLRHGEQQQRSNSSGTTPVLICPLLSLSDLNTLNSCTNFYQVEWWIVFFPPSFAVYITHYCMLFGRPLGRVFCTVYHLFVVICTICIVAKQNGLSEICLNQ